MTRKTCKMKRKRTEHFAVKPQTRTPHFWKWASVVLLLFVAALTAAFPKNGAEASKTATATQAKHPTEAKPSLTPETEVLAYVGGQNDWQPKLLKELVKGQEFQFDNHLCYVDQNGFIRMNPGVDITLLSEADRYFEEDNWRFPESKDIVRFVDQGRNHRRHDRMGTLKANDRFYFQGRLYEAVADAKSAATLSIRKTGTVLRPPHYPRSYDDEEIDSKTWRSIQLEKKESDGSLTRVNLLRPTWWLDEYKASQGGFIYLDLAEMGASGRFEVKSIDPCPEIAPGPAGTQPVIGKFTHENAVVLDLYFEGESKPLGVTANHPIWSETHQKYLPAGEFKIGDEVRTLNGKSKLVEVAQRPGRHTVYNLEIHRDHVYRVGESAILVHNKQPGRVVFLDADALVKMGATSKYLRAGDDLMVSPNVVRELMEGPLKIKDVAAFLRARGVRIAPSAPGAAVPATKIRQILDAIKPHRGNRGDALNISEAAGHGADIFITGDKRAVRALVGGTHGILTLPNSGGTRIFLQALE